MPTKLLSQVLKMGKGDHSSEGPVRPEFNSWQSHFFAFFCCPDFRKLRYPTPCAAKKRSIKTHAARFRTSATLQKLKGSRPMSTPLAPPPKFAWPLSCVPAPGRPKLLGSLHACKRYSFIQAGAHFLRHPIYSCAPVAAWPLSCVPAQAAPVGSPRE